MKSTTTPDLTKLNPVAHDHTDTNRGSTCRHGTSIVSTVTSSIILSRRSIIIVEMALEATVIWIRES